MLGDKDLDETVVEAENEREGSSRLVLQIKSLFQVVYYQITHGRHKTPMQVTNAHAIYEKCRSRELITAFNKQSACISYKSMKLQRTSLANYTILKRLEVGMPLPSHFDKGSFTVRALDNFDNADKNSLSGMEHAHGTVFHVRPNVIASKPKKSTVNLTSVQSLNKLPCQEIANSRFNQKLPFDNSFSVEDELYSNEEVIKDQRDLEFIVGCAQSIPPETADTKVSSWPGMRALLSKSEIPEM